MSNLLTQAEVIAALRSRSYGKQAVLAFEAGVSEPHVSDVLKGKKPPSPKLLALVGMRRVLAFERVSK